MYIQWKPQQVVNEYFHNINVYTCTKSFGQYNSWKHENVHKQRLCSTARVKINTCTMKKVMVRHASTWSRVHLKLVHNHTSCRGHVNRKYEYSMSPINVDMCTINCVRYEKCKYGHVYNEILRSTTRFNMSTCTIKTCTVRVMSQWTRVQWKMYSTIHVKMDTCTTEKCKVRLISKWTRVQ